MAKKLLHEYVKTFIESQGYQLFDHYKNTRTKLLLKCPIGHDYKTTFHNFQQGSRCPSCLMLSYDYVKNYIESQGYQLLSPSYKNTKTKLLLKCPIGHDYKVSFHDFQKGNRCPFCARNIKHTYGYVKNFIELQGYQLLSKSYKNVRTKLLLKCPIGHEYKTTFNKFRIGRRCQFCAGNIKHTYEHVKNFIELQGYQLLSKSYKNASTKLLLKCPIGHDYKVSFHKFQQGVRCQQCYFESASSKAEQDLALYVESLGIEIIKNDRSIITNPLTGKNLELDIYIPSLNKAIEYNGLYWHSFLDKQKNDDIKKDQCKQLGINLLIVNEDNWLNYQEIEQLKIREWIKCS